MIKRTLGNTGFKISEIGLGTWQVGGKWGSLFDDTLADNILNAAFEKGVNFIDTADVYSEGYSEKAVGRFLKTHKDDVFVATKCGRQINPHTTEGYTPAVLQKYVEDSLSRLSVDCLDLIQLHCPPTEVYRRDDIFELFDRLKDQGKIKNLGVSIEKVEEGLMAMAYNNVTSIQVIFNIFRQKPAEELFPTAKEKNVGIIVRVPLASGLLTGKFGKNTTFEKDDHRNFNRNGEVFDKGETFSGVPYDLGLKAVAEIEATLGAEVNLAQAALAWILQFPEVSTIIPGASNISQVHSNTAVDSFPKLTANQIKGINNIYNSDIKPVVHHNW